MDFDELLDWQTLLRARSISFPSFFALWITEIWKRVISQFQCSPFEIHLASSRARFRKGGRKFVGIKIRFVLFLFLFSARNENKILRERKKGWFCFSAPISRLFRKSKLLHPLVFFFLYFSSRIQSPWIIHWLVLSIHLRQTKCPIITLLIPLSIFKLWSLFRDTL